MGFNWICDLMYIHQTLCCTKRDHSNYFSNMKISNMLGHKENISKSLKLKLHQASILIRRPYEERVTGQTPCEDGGLEWCSYTAGMPKTDSKLPQARERHRQTSLQVSEGTWPCRHLDFGLLIFRIMRQQISVVLSQKAKETKRNKNLQTKQKTPHKNQKTNQVTFFKPQMQKNNIKRINKYTDKTKPSRN